MQGYCFTALGAAAVIKDRLLVLLFTTPLAERWHGAAGRLLLKIRGYINLAAESSLCTSADPLRFG